MRMKPTDSDILGAFSLPAARIGAHLCPLRKGRARGGYGTFS